MARLPWFNFQLYSFMLRKYRLKDDDNTEIFQVFELRIGMNEFDPRSIFFFGCFFF